MPSRLEREIDEILRNVDDLPAERKKRRSPLRAVKVSLAHAWDRFRDLLGRISIGHLIIAGFILMIAAAILRSDLGTWVMLAGLALLLTAFFVSLFRRRRPATAARQEMRWRGRVIHLEDESFGSKFKSFWRRRRR